MEPGARVGHYEILDRLGSGGMGDVYRARDARLDRVVALKVLRDASDPELLSRLDREARAASRLNHPNIVQVYDVGKPADGPPFVVMEHVEGDTLRRRMNRERLPIAQVVDWGVQLAEGLAAAHAAGIVHRDLKPENVMITRDDRVKILDFGLAKLTGSVLGDIDTRSTLSRHATQAGTLLGTLEYMAPEQATGKPLDGRADQFALGALLYEMASGRSPFHRGTAAEVLAAVLERHPEPLRGVPDSLAAVVARCLAKEPGGRFASTGEIAHALRRRDTVPSIVSAEIVGVRPAPAPDRPSTWSVQSRDKVKVYDEGKLADSIRRGRLTGLELVRREGDEEWQPLYESRVYRREVPAGSNPLRAAQWRSLRAPAASLGGFVATGLVMYATSGHVPFWMAFWGAGLVGHLMRAAPAAIALVRAERSLPAPAAPAAVPALPASPLEQEAARIRALLEKRDDRDRLLADVDGIVKHTAELAARIADLEEQTTPSERNAVASSEDEARARVGRATTPEDRDVFERQLQVVERRRQGIDHAIRLLDRLRARRETAEHELKQLRLDLTRGAAVEMPMPELSSRLQFIRHEVAAAEEIGRP